MHQIRQITGSMTEVAVEGAQIIEVASLRAGSGVKVGDADHSA